MKPQRPAYLIVMPTGADVIIDGAVVASGHPDVPGTWSSFSIDAGWSEHVTPTGVIVHACRLNTWTADPSKALFLVVQRVPDGTGALINLAGRAGTVWGDRVKATWEACRADDTTAKNVMRHVPSWKVTGVGPGGAFTGVRRILLDTQRMPLNFHTDPGPWHIAADGSEVAHAAEHYHITAWHRPAVFHEIAGYDDHTPEAGTPEN